MAGDRVPVMGLYEGLGQRGPYLRGKLGRAMVWIFKNDRKLKDTDPDWTMYLAPDNRETTASRGSAIGPEPPSKPDYRPPVAAPVSEPAPWDGGSAENVGPGDDIPF